MSELCKFEDWKLKAQAVVKLCRKKCDKSVTVALSVLSMTNVKKLSVVQLPHCAAVDSHKG